MANHKSAKTRINRNSKRSVINGARKSRVRTFVKKVEAAIAASDKETASTALKVAESETRTFEPHPPKNNERGCGFFCFKTAIFKESRPTLGKTPVKKFNYNVL